MLKKAIRTIFLMCVLLLIACGAERDETKDTDLEKMAENNADTGTGDSVESKPEALTGELTILSWVPSNKWKHVIEGFTQEHPGVTVTVDMPKQEEVLTEEFVERYNTRIMTGDGIDIVESDLVNMERCMEQGLFVDMYELMDADEDFNREDYFSCIFEPVEIDGKLPAFVYNVQPVYIHLNKKLLEEAGLEYTEDTISFKELYGLYEKVRETAGEQIFLTPDGYGYEGMCSYETNYFIRNNLIDSDEYEEYLKMCHELYCVSEYRPLRGDGTMKIADDVLCCPSDLRLPGNNANEVFEGTEGMTGAICYESMHGERYFYGASNVAVSSFSENKKLAWEFIKYAFSDKETSQEYSSYISPNKGKAEIVCEGLTPENKEKLYRDIEAINTMSYSDMDLNNSFLPVYEDYFMNNTITSEECRKELAGRVYLYLNE